VVQKATYRRIGSVASFASSPGPMPGGRFEHPGRLICVGSGRISCLGSSGRIPSYLSRLLSKCPPDGGRYGLSPGGSRAGFVSSPSVAHNAGALKGVRLLATRNSYRLGESKVKSYFRFGAVGQRGSSPWGWYRKREEHAS